MADEQKQDFSGEFVLNRQIGALSPAVADAIQISMVFDSKPIEHTFELMTDGREVSSTDEGRTTVCTMYWEENSLVFTARTTGPGFEFAMSWRYELLDNQRKLRAVEQIRGGGRDQDNVWLFERRQAVAI